MHTLFFRMWCMLIDFLGRMHKNRCKQFIQISQDLVKHCLHAASDRSILFFDIKDVFTVVQVEVGQVEDRKSTRLNSSHVAISYAVFCLKKKIKTRSRLVLSYAI